MRVLYIVYAYWSHAYVGYTFKHTILHPLPQKYYYIQVMVDYAYQIEVLISTRDVSTFTLGGKYSTLEWKVVQSDSIVYSSIENATLSV